MFSGSFAGGACVRNNLDGVAASLPGVIVRGVIDSSFNPAAGGASLPDPDPERVVRMAFWNAQLDEPCLAAVTDSSVSLSSLYLTVNHLATP
jgi:hypothetical protein